MTLTDESISVYYGSALQCTGDLKSCPPAEVYLAVDLYGKASEVEISGLGMLTSGEPALLKSSKKATKANGSSDAVCSVGHPYERIEWETMANFKKDSCHLCGSVRPLRLQGVCVVCPVVSSPNLRGSGSGPRRERAYRMCLISSMLVGTGAPATSSSAVSASTGGLRKVCVTVPLLFVWATRGPGYRLPCAFFHAPAGPPTR